jgi:hypothetical protein
VLCELLLFVEIEWNTLHSDENEINTQYLENKSMFNVCVFSELVLLSENENEARSGCSQANQTTPFRNIIQHCTISISIHFK